MRPLLDSEIPLMRWLLAKAQRPESLDGLLVEPLDDGEMGSLRIGPTGIVRQFGRSLSEAEFTDRDGTLVMATLNADDEGHLLELDMWRVDFAPLQRWPLYPEIREVVYNASRNPNASGRN